MIDVHLNQGSHTKVVNLCFPMYIGQHSFVQFLRIQGDLGVRMKLSQTLARGIFGYMCD